MLVDTSPEVLTNSQLSFSLIDRNRKEAIVNVSLLEDWRFLPHFPLFPFLEIPRKADDKFVIGFPSWKILQGDT
jgi:hypothetical protein